MKTFKQYLEEVKEPTGKLKDACWKGYTAVGTKNKNGRTVPNCVPEETSISEDGAAAVAAGPTNVVGGGAIAGAGVGSQGEPGVHQTVGLKKTNSLKNKSKSFIPAKPT